MGRMFIKSTRRNCDAIGNVVNLTTSLAEMRLDNGLIRSYPIGQIAYLQDMPEIVKPEEEGYRYHMKITGVCEALHMGVTGAADRLDADERERLMAWLHWRLDHWEPSPTNITRGNPNTMDHDQAIRMLIDTTLAEVEFDDKHREL